MNFDQRLYSQYYAALKCMEDFDNIFEDSMIFNLNNFDNNYMNIKQKTYSDNILINTMISVYNMLNCGEKNIDLSAYHPMEIIQITKSKHVTCNCISHALVLQYVFSNMGLYARILRCLPLDIHYKECHVMTEVYDFTKRKWLLFDPANKTCFMSESGEILSALEVRDRLIHKLPIKFVTDSPISNLLQRYFYSYYRVYLTKNFVRFAAFIDNKSIITLRKDICVLTPKVLAWWSADVYEAEEFISIADSDLLMNIKYTSNIQLFWPKF